MFLVISKWHGGLLATKEVADPRKSISYKSRKQSIAAIVALSSLADGLSLDVLLQMYKEGLFDKPSRFKQEE